MKRLLITGAHGFIGRHVLRFLPADVETLAPMRHECDFLDKRAFGRLLADFKPSHLIHLAWHGGSDYAHSPRNRLWLEAGKDLIDLFYKNGGSHFIGTGTCYEYVFDKPVMREDDAGKATPHTLYGLCKLELGAFLRERASTAHKAWTWARPFFLTGPGENASRLAPSLARSLLSGQKFRIAAARRVLDYMDVRDAARAFTALLVADGLGPVNICSGKGVSLAEFGLELAAMCGGENGLELGNDEIQPMRCVGGNEKLILKTGYEPAYSLSMALRDGVECVKEGKHGNE